MPIVPTRVACSCVWMTTNSLWFTRLVVSTTAFALAACGGGGGAGSPVAPGPSLSVLAFGDSLTSGVGASQPYPEKLRAGLGLVYTKGAVVVTNGGRPGELASAGVARLAALLQPPRHFVLIMEGVNDLNAKVNDPANPNDLDTAATALTSMVQQAKASGATVVLATLPPQRPGWLLLTGRPAKSPDLIDALNARIRQIAADQGVALADVSAAFNGDLSLIGADGLHPTQAGYDRIADTFLAVLRPAVAVL